MPYQKENSSSYCKLTHAEKCISFFHAQKVCGKNFTGILETFSLLYSQAVLGIMCTFSVLNSRLSLNPAVLWYVSAHLQLILEKSFLWDFFLPIGIFPVGPDRKILKGQRTFGHFTIMDLDICSLTPSTLVISPFLSACSQIRAVESPAGLWPFMGFTAGPAGEHCGHALKCPGCGGNKLVL